MFDQIWNGLLWILPDAEVGKFEIKDLLSVGIAVIGIRVALIASRIATKQDELSDQLRAKSAKLAVRADTSQIAHGAQFLIIPIEALNTGDRGAAGFHCELYLPGPATHDLVMVDPNGNPLASFGGIQMADDKVFDQWDSHVQTKVFPGSAILAGRIRVKRTLSSFKLLWRIRHDDGISPEGEGLGVVRFEKGSDGFFNPTAQPSENQKP